MEVFADKAAERSDVVIELQQLRGAVESHWRVFGGAVLIATVARHDIKFRSVVAMYAGQSRMGSFEQLSWLVNGPSRECTPGISVICVLFIFWVFE